MKFFIPFLFFTILLGAGSCAKNGQPADESKVFDGTGEVLALDKQNGSVTIDHGDIEGLMSAMTMDFDVRDGKLLEDIAVGDEVKFSLKRNGEEIEVISILKTGSRAISGAEVYRESCARCHGKKGEGAKKGISLIEGHALSHPKEDFLKQVRDGGKKMPSFSDKLSEKEIIAVVRHVREVIQKDLREDEGHEH